MSFWQLAVDHDWCLPASMASGAQANLSSADGSVASRERVVGSTGALRPSRGAEDVYAQARTLFRAMVQVPHYSDEVRRALRVFKALRVLQAGVDLQNLHIMWYQVTGCVLSIESTVFLTFVPVRILRQIGEILRSSLEDYFVLVQNKFQDITINR